MEVVQAAVGYAINSFQRALAGCPRKPRLHDETIDRPRYGLRRVCSAVQRTRRVIHLGGDGIVQNLSNRSGNLLYSSFNYFPGV